MIASLGVPVVLCAALGGETGEVLRHLIAVEGVEVDIEPVNARNGGYVHDRRDGQRQGVVEAPGGALDRHELDGLYERWPVIGDLSGSQLKATLAGGPLLIKVSHEELMHDGWASSEQATDLVAAMHRLREDGAGAVVVSRAAQPALALVDDEVFEVRMPPLELADPRGAGDSMTAGFAASLARGESMLTALRVGAACGALNVVRRGLGTGGSAAVATLAKRVELRRWDP